jgi:hypothetical protein
MHARTFAARPANLTSSPRSGLVEPDAAPVHIDEVHAGIGRSNGCEVGGNDRTHRKRSIDTHLYAERVLVERFFETRVRAAGG